ncbi:MAG: outer membrane beta-barrel protein [Bacteroidales bacterium]|nr:outer membrane beta-barrel protein [Bacteroidales bacterium]
MRKGLLLATLMLVSFLANAQLIKDRTNGQVTMGFDLFSDINTGAKYENFDLRAINQGWGTYLTYNFPMGESKHTVSLGGGYSCHNFYMKNAWLAEPYTHAIEFTEAPIKKSRVTFHYMDIPLEVNLRIADKFKISFGAKVSFLIQANSKAVGYMNYDGHKWEIKYNNINAVESIVYSSFARFGYRSINLYVGYQFNSSFKEGRGPAVLPFSIGIGIRPY